MSKRILSVCLALMLACSCMLICSPAALAESETAMTLTSKSANDDHCLLRACAYTKNTSPKGGGKSPQLSWSKVEGAKYYAVYMFDITANWSHWLVKAIPAKKTSLKLGAYKKSNGYIGPYPPKGSGRHTYRIRVFALKDKPDTFKYQNNKPGDMFTVIEKLDTHNKMSGNVIDSVYLDLSYEYGDKTKK